MITETFIYSIVIAAIREARRDYYVSESISILWIISQIDMLG